MQPGLESAHVPACLCVLSVPVLKWMPFPARCEHRLEYNMVRTGTKHMVFSAYDMDQSKEETAFSLLESLATVLRKLSAKKFASERVLRHSAMRRHIQSVFAVTCLNQNFQNLSSLSYSFQIANGLPLLVLRIFIVIITMTFNVVNNVL